MQQSILQTACINLMANCKSTVITDKLKVYYIDLFYRVQLSLSCISPHNNPVYGMGEHQTRPWTDGRSVQSQSGEQCLDCTLVDGGSWGDVHHHRSQDLQPNPNPNPNPKSNR